MFYILITTIMNIERKRLLLSIYIPAFLIAAIIATHLCSVLLSIDFTNLGIYPRETKGIIGIVTHVFVHASWEHLLSNCIPLLLLSWCLFYFYKDWAFAIIAFIWILSGILTFTIGRPNWHIGASGLIYGLAFFNFTAGIISKTKTMIAISLLTTFLYGGFVWSIMPYFVKASISWEGHLSGAIAGVIAALLFYNKCIYAKEEKRIYNDEEDEMLYKMWQESLYEKPHLTDTSTEQNKKLEDDNSQPPTYSSDNNIKSDSCSSTAKDV